MNDDIVHKLQWPSAFVIDSAARTVTLRDASNGTDTAKAINASFQSVVDAAIDSGDFPWLNDQHSEMYPILGARHQPVSIERYTASMFGIIHRGAHLTAYVRTPDGLKIWVSRRAAHLATWPGKLDNTVAGGIKAGHSPWDCILAESDEEASLAADLVWERARVAGAITYATKSRRTGLTYPDVLYVYDMELPAEVVPKPKDDEVEEFVLMTVDEVKGAMVRGEFKPNSNLVTIDFLLRHGVITPENEPDYVEILTRLHRRLPVPLAP